MGEGNVGVLRWTLQELQQGHQGTRQRPPDQHDGQRAELDVGLFVWVDFVSFVGLNQRWRVIGFLSLEFPTHTAWRLNSRRQIHFLIPMDDTTK